MKRNWHPEELAEQWSLNFDELSALKGKQGTGRIAFAALLKYIKIEGCFPQKHSDVPIEVLDYLAEQVSVSTQLFKLYDFQSRSAQRDREKIRELTGYRLFGISDDVLIKYLKDNAVATTLKEEQLNEAVLSWCKQQRLEPPTQARIERLIASAVNSYEQDLFVKVSSRLSKETKVRIDKLLITPSDSDGVDGKDNLSSLRGDPGRVSLNTVLTELEKLKSIENLGLTSKHVEGVAVSWLEKYQERVAAEPLRELRRHPDAIRYCLVTAFCWQRRKEIIDSLVDLVIDIVHKISVKADKKVVQVLLKEVTSVRGKDTLLYHLAEATLANPDGIIRDVIYPVVSEQKLADLIREYKASGPAYQRQVYKVIRASYGSYYRRMMPILLDTLNFRSNNSLHQPIIQALQKLKELQASKQQYVAVEEVPIQGVIKANQQDYVIELDRKGKPRVNRINYEIQVLKTLREALRCKEVWVEGADRFRNPDEDLPTDFESKRDTYYQLLEQPLEADTFITQLKSQMTDSLKMLNDGLPKNKKLKLVDRAKRHILLTPLDPLPEPKNLLELKTELVRQWPMTDLLDMLKETDFRINFTEVFKSTAQREIIPRDELQKRLLLSLYGLGTNTGLKRVSANEDRIRYTDLLYTRRRFINKRSLRNAIAKVVNATFAVRNPLIWGEGTTACASDAKKFGAWDQNLMTEWHIRYGGRGVMIYWHVEKNACCIHSQLKRCSSSEVAAMIEGVLHHCTEMEVEKNYVDTHGQSEVAFAFCHLLGFELLPRLKNLASQKLALAEAGTAASYPNLELILKKPINWELIRQQYDEMIKFATALRLGTAETESILRRFTRNNIQHPTYKALAELGKAVKTIFLCRYLHEESLRQEIHEGLQVIETWNSANSFIFYGKGGEVATNRLADQEVSVLALHLLQMTLVYINTLMLQNVLDKPGWISKLEKEDFRALSPLMYNHMNPYGSFELDMNKRLKLAA